MLQFLTIPRSWYGKKYSIAILMHG